MPQQQPFRKPAPEDDVEDQSWTPPSYAKPSESSDEWKPPSYASPVETKKSSPGIFSRAFSDVKDFVTPAEKIHPSGDAVKAVDTVKNIAGKVYDFATSTPEAVKKFSSGVENYLTDPNHQIMQESGKGGIHDAAAKTLSEIQGGLAGSAKAAADQFLTPLNAALTASGIGEAKTGLPAFRYATRTLSTPMIASGARKLLGGDSSLSDRGAGLAEMAGGLVGLHSPEIATSEELPVQQRGSSLPGKLTDTTPQQDAIAIAQTRDNIPRTPANISDETGIPKPSIRRTISEIKKKTAVEPDDKSGGAGIIGTNAEAAGPEASDWNRKHVALPKSFIADDAKLPPADASNEDMQKFADSVRNSTVAQSSETGEKPLPLRTPNLDPNRFNIGVEENKPTSGINEDTLYNLARERFNMGKELPQAEEPPVEPPKRMFNPFEKKAPEEISNIQRNAPYGEGSIMPSTSIPTEFREPAETKPTATFAYNWPEVGDQYLVKGGPYDGSHVGIDRLKEQGIDIPEEKPEQTEQGVKDKAAAEAKWKAPSYAQPSAGESITEKPRVPDKYGRMIDEQRSHKGEGWNPPQGIASKATSKLQEFEDAARARIKQRGTFSGGRLLSGLPADDLADLGIIGATKIARGLVKFTDWSAEMLSNFGESIRPHLRDIFNAAKDKHEEFTNAAFKKLYNGLVEYKGAAGEQQVINKACLLYTS